MELWDYELSLGFRSQLCHFLLGVLGWLTQPLWVTGRRQWLSWRWSLWGTQSPPLPTPMSSATPASYPADPTKQSVSALDFKSLLAKFHVPQLQGSPSIFSQAYSFLINPVWKFFRFWAKFQKQHRGFLHTLTQFPLHMLHNHSTFVKAKKLTLVHYCSLNPRC